MSFFWAVVKSKKLSLHSDYGSRDVVENSPVRFRRSVKLLI